MNPFEIIKVNHLTNKNKTNTIYVFCGSKFSEDVNELNKQFKENPNNDKFKSVFNLDELYEIDKNNINVKFIHEVIHLDDNIGVIKLKVFEAISKIASMSEIYLFCLIKEKINPITVYQSLTQNDKLPLTKIRMDQILLNLYDENGQPADIQLPNQKQYNFDDILNLDLNEKSYLLGKPLGQKFVFASEYPFVADPFLINEYDILLENSRKELSTLNTNLLLETGPIYNNTIYLCLAEDVFNMDKKISTNYTSKIYYPFLYKDKIEDLDKLKENQNKLISATSEKITPDTEIIFKQINMFYDVYQSSTQSEEFSENSKLSGIKNLKIVIHPDFKVKIPIDVIFKLIHATHDFPLIKYNPKSKQENIYRLFAPELTIDGKKIPFLKKSEIFKLMKTIGKTTSVAVYTNIQYNNLDIFIVCEFYDDGIITIYPLVDFDNPILLIPGDNTFKEIDFIISSAINPLIEQIKPFFEQSGLEIPLFKSIQSTNVEIRDMKYQNVYSITQNISSSIKTIQSCISSVFTIESINSETNILMRYKRVSNFNKRDSQEAFIIEKIDQGLKIEEIRQELLQQFSDLNDDEAIELIATITNELQFIRGANKRRALMIKINPGFQTIFQVDPITSNLTILVNGINNIYYLNTIPIYINTIVRLTQDINSTSIESSNILSLCSGSEVEDIEFDQIIAQSEENFYDNAVPIIQDESPIYNQEEQNGRIDELLDILGVEDNDDEDEYDELEGGKGSSDNDDEEDDDDDEDSSKSVSTEKLSIPKKDENINEDSDINLSDLSIGTMDNNSSSSKEDIVTTIPDKVSSSKNNTIKEKVESPESVSEEQSESPKLDSVSVIEENVELPESDSESVIEENVELPESDSESVIKEQVELPESDSESVI